MLPDMLDQGTQRPGGLVPFGFRQILEQVRETRLPGPGLCDTYPFQRSLRVFVGCPCEIGGGLVKALQHSLFPLPVSPQEPGHCCSGP